VRRYQTLVGALSRGLRIANSTRVLSVDASAAAGVVVATDNGTFRADRVVVTLPLGVLQASPLRACACARAHVCGRL
jgi:monoamine oxidase